MKKAAVMTWVLIRVIVGFFVSVHIQALPVSWRDRGLARRSVYCGFGSFVSDHRNPLSAFFSVDTVLSMAKEFEGDNEWQERMALIRSIQTAYYASPSDDAEKTTSVDKESGTIKSLPLWRVPWTELPGRSNVLNVHEMQYTHMFEMVIRGPKPWLIGHLYLPGGSKNLNSKEEHYRLQTWDDKRQKALRRGGVKGSSVVGTLLRIADYRRMHDGKLLVLVQALERFIVEKSVRELPYSIADVRLLPDLEEIQFQLCVHMKSTVNPSSKDNLVSCEKEIVDGRWSDENSLLLSKESQIVRARAQAVKESFRWHDYEYDPDIKLPVRTDENGNFYVSDVNANSLTQVLPFVPCSATTHPSHILKSLRDERGAKGFRFCAECPQDGMLCMERRLIGNNVFVRPSPEQLAGRTSNDLERELWILVNEYVRLKKVVIHPELLSLLPLGKKWSNDFILEDAASELSASRSLVRSFLRVSPDYPAHRRQRKLSYHALAILEGGSDVRDMRQIILEIPSIRGKLCAVLREFEIAISKFKG